MGTISADEIARGGSQIYDSQLKPRLEPRENGREVAICVEDGDYEVADTMLEALSQLRVRHPDSLFFFRRIGGGGWDWLLPRQTTSPNGAG